MPDVVKSMIVTWSDAKPGVVPVDGGTVIAATGFVNVARSGVPVRSSVMVTTAPSMLMNEVSVCGCVGSPRGTTWLPTRKTGAYSTDRSASRVPALMTGCVGSAVNVQVMPAVTNWGASTSYMNSVLLSWTQAGKGAATKMAPPTSKTPVETCPQTRFIGILQGGARRTRVRHTRRTRQSVPPRRSKSQKRGDDRSLAAL